MEKKKLGGHKEKRQQKKISPFNGGNGRGVVRWPLTNLWLNSEWPDKILSVSIFTQLCGELGFAVEVNM